MRQALAPRGRAVVVEFVPNEDRITPPPSAMFSLVMLTGTRAGDAYTFPELRQAITNAGFSSCQLHDIPNNFQRAIIAQV